MSGWRRDVDLPEAPGGVAAWDAAASDEEWLVTAGSPGVMDAPGMRGSSDESNSRVTHAVDPVKALMHRHRELCERAVDPLEIAAGLEAQGVTARTVARFRHRDVFSLAEEIYARVPRDDGTGPGAAAVSLPKVRADWALLALLPGAVCAAAVIGLRLTETRPRLAVVAAVLGVLAIALSLRLALGRGPLHTPRAWRTTLGTRVWTCWLLGYALLGNGLLGAALAGGPDSWPNGDLHSPWPVPLASVTALALGCVPAAGCAHLFAARARRRLAASRVLEEFATSVRPLVLGVFGLFLCVLGGLLALCGTLLDESAGPAANAGTGGLGALLLLARLLTVHGFTHAPAVVLAATGATEVTAVASVFAGRLPGCSFLAVPVETVVDAGGPGAVPALVCGAAALVLLVHATRTLTRASAHANHGWMR